MWHVQIKFLNSSSNITFKFATQQTRAFITNFILYPDWHKIHLIHIIMFQPITLMKLILIFVMQRHHIYSVKANNCLVSCYSLVTHNRNSALQPPPHPILNIHPRYGCVNLLLASFNSLRNKELKCMLDANKTTN